MAAEMYFDSDVPLSYGSSALGSAAGDSGASGSILHATPFDDDDDDDGSNPATEIYAPAPQPNGDDGNYGNHDYADGLGNAGYYGNYGGYYVGDPGNHDNNTGNTNADPVTNAQPAGSRVGSHASSHRPRGSRGRGGARSSASHGSGSAAKPKWRSGQIPPAPVFEGDIDQDPYCLRHYKKRLLRWIRITKEFLPPNEQALRAREQLRGEAEIEFEEVDDSRFDHPDGINRLLQDLSESFGEKEIFRQGGAIREFEAMGRLQGESIQAFVRRFRLLERKLQDSKVPTYPEQARVIKLLDGLRLDERSTSTLLLAAGNRYEMVPILDAIKLHYPAGMSVTGLPLRSATSSSLRRSAPSKQKSKRITHWHTDWYEGAEALANETEEPFDLDDEETPADVTASPNEYDDVDYLEDYPEDDNAEEVGDGEDQEAAPSDDFLETLQALTVTSRRLAELTKARGFFKANDKGHSKGKSKGSKGKGKGKSKSKQQSKMRLKFSGHTQIFKELQEKSTNNSKNSNKSSNT